MPAVALPPASSATAAISGGAVNILRSEDFMEWHIKCDPGEISRYIFCPGDQKRAKKIADQFDTSRANWVGR